MNAGLQKTEIGKFPSTWEINRVDSAFEIQQGKQVSKKNREGGNQRPFLRTKNVFWNRLELSELDEMNFTETEEARLELQPGDLLTCEGGDIGRTALWDGEAQRCYYQNHLHRLRVANDRADAQFSVYWFWYAFDVAKLYFGRGNVTTIPNLSRSKLAELPMAFPPLPEQKKIAHVLSTVQRAIDAQERIIQTTTELFKSMLHQLMTAQISVSNGDRIEGDSGGGRGMKVNGAAPEPWPEIPLSDLICGKLQNGAFVKKPEKGRGLLFANVVNMYGSVHLDYQSLERLNVEEPDIDGYKLSEGDVLVVRSSLKREGIGQSCIVTNIPETVFYDCHLIRVVPDKTKVFPEFLSFYWRSPIGKQDLVNRSKTTTMTTINQAGLLGAIVPLPPLPEQKKIAHILSTIQQKIDNAQSKKNKLQDIFRTLLHELMTAKITVSESLDAIK